MPQELQVAWKDISSEEYRIYVYPDDWRISINKPSKLHVSASGGHRIVTEDGLSYYIAPGWRVIQWKGNPAFVC